MSPRTKKILLIGAAAVAGYIAYRRFKAPAAAATTAVPVTSATKAAQLAALSSKIAALKSPLKISGWS